MKYLPVFFLFTNKKGLHLCRFTNTYTYTGERMKFLFIVQGEGRGHLTQSIALKSILEKNGHQVVGAMVGRSKTRELPDFYARKMNTPIYRFESPNFLPSPKNKQANVWKTAAYNIARVPTYMHSVYYIRKMIKELDVDRVVNFYDMLTGLAYALFPPNVPLTGVSHQYLFLHPRYKFPDENRFELFILKLYTRITGINADKRIALSLTKWDDVPGQRIVVAPPLLREEVFRVPVSKGNYIHGYMLNSGFAEEVIEFQQRCPEVYMRFFWDRKGAGEIEHHNDHLSFYRLNDHLFLESLAGCMAYATTAGFESVCEAMYMGKPVLMVPTHIEQACNAYEAAEAGAGIVSESFDLARLIDYAEDYEANRDFRQWVEQSEAYWMGALE